MLFNTFNFWIIYPLLFIIYWVIPYQYVKIKKWYLVILSYLLYMNYKPAYALILFSVTAITYCGALYLQHKEKKKLLIFILTLASILPLLIFKYYNFLNDTIINILSLYGMHANLPGLNWAIPVGISFLHFKH